MIVKYELTVDDIVYSVESKTCKDCKYMAYFLTDELACCITENNPNEIKMCERFE